MRIMKNRIAMTFLALAMMFTTSCASLGRFSPGYDSFDRGLALFNQGRFDAAIPYFEDATHENPEFGQAYFYLGRAFVSQSQWRAEIPSLPTTFRLSPSGDQPESMDLMREDTFPAAVVEV